MPTVNLVELRELIGLRIRYREEVYLVLEVIEDAPALVIQSEHAEHSIQTDVHGYPRRRLPETLTVTVLTEDGAEYHPDFLEIERL